MDEMLRAISATVDSRGDDIAGFLQELIAIPTPNPPGENYEKIAGLLREHFQQVGVEMQKTYIPLAALASYGIDGSDYPRPAILGRCGNQDHKALHLHGHFDVVPANSAEQYRPVHHNGRIHGRGAADMKGGLSAMWGAFLVLQECGLKPGRPVSLSITPDEESGGETGAGYLIRNRVINPEDIAFLIMPECTSGDIWNASKGALVVDVALRGKAAHSTLSHLGRNAFEDMLSIAQVLVGLRKKVETRYSRCPVDDPRAARSTMVLGGEGGGGEKFNVVPGHYHFTVDRRPIPEETLDEVHRELFAVQDQARALGIDVTFNTWLQAIPAFTDPEESGCQILAQALSETTGHTPRFLLCPGFLDIRHFNGEGVPAVACGPGRLEVAHGPEEWLDETDLLSYVKGLSLTMLRM